VEALVVAERGEHEFAGAGHQPARGVGVGASERRLVPAIADGKHVVDEDWGFAEDQKLGSLSGRGFRRSSTRRNSDSSRGCLSCSLPGVAINNYTPVRLC